MTSPSVFLHLYQCFSPFSSSSVTLQLNYLVPTTYRAATKSSAFFLTPLDFFRTHWHPISCVFKKVFLYAVSLSASRRMHLDLRSLFCLHHRPQYFSISFYQYKSSRWSSSIYSAPFRIIARNFSNKLLFPNNHQLSLHIKPPSLALALSQNNFIIT